MAISRKTGAAVLAVVATLLTVLGVVLAATDSNPGGLTSDNLALNGYPPRTAEIQFVISTGQTYSVNADVKVNFRTNAIEALVQVPLVFSGATFDARMLNKHLYVTSSNMASAVGKPWLGTAMNLPALFNYSLELVKPDVALISGFDHESVTKNGDLTTYTFLRDNVAVSRLGSKKGALAGVGKLVLSITTGKQGEATAAAITISGENSETSISATVLSFNKPVHVVAPPLSQVKTVNSHYIRGLLGATPITSLLIPSNLNSLGSTHLN
ncbi:MAG: hypothetical protein ACYC1I_07085 [Acidimicrobiales bacterium]